MCLFFQITSPKNLSLYDSDSDQSCDDTSSNSSMSFDSSSGDEQVELNTYRNIQNMKPSYQPPETSRTGESLSRAKYVIFAFSPKKEKRTKLLI